MTMGSFPADVVVSVSRSVSLTVSDCVVPEAVVCATFSVFSAVAANFRTGGENEADDQ